MQLKKFFVVLAVVFLSLINFNQAQACGTLQGSVTGLFDSVYHLDIQGNYVYAPTGNDLYVINVSNPIYPILSLGSATFTKTVTGIKVSGDYAYLTGGSGYFFVVDISGLPQKTYDNQISTIAYDHGRGLCVRGSHVYATYCQSGLHILDVSDPANVSEVSITSIANACDVVVYDNYAFVAAGSGIQVVDISNLANPVIGQFLPGIGLPKKLELRWPYLYVANSDFSVINVSDPTNISLAATISTYYITQDLYVADNEKFVFLSNNVDRGGQYQIINIDDPENPFSVCVYLLSGVRSVVAKGNVAFYGMWTSYVQAVEFDLPPVLTITESSQGRVEGTLVGETEPCINCGDGQTTCSVVLADNDQIELTAYPKAGYAFDYFDDGLTCNYSNPLTLTMTEDVVLEGVFDNFSLGFPVNGYTSTTVPISAVLDHTVFDTNPVDFYQIDGTVRAFNGEIGSSDYYSDCSGTVCGYSMDLNNTYFLTSYNYTGNEFLYYDGHSGFDFAIPSGTNILAPADGKLYWATSDPVNGNVGSFNTFYIDHENGYTTWFLHCSSLTATVLAEIQQNGYAMVSKGSHIAESGDVGATGSYHLHFEVRLNGVDDENVIDPYYEGLWE